MLKQFLGIGRKSARHTADRLYEQIVAAARQPVPYSEWNIPDTALGRYEMLALHVFLALHRLRAEPAAEDVAQELTDAFFLDVDHSLRELGIGDMGIPKRMKKLARMFYGRAASYGEAIDRADPVALAAALRRNVMPDAEAWDGAAPLGGYVMEAWSALAAQPLDGLLAGEIRFPAPAALPREATR